MAIYTTEYKGSRVRLIRDSGEIFIVRSDLEKIFRSERGRIYAISGASSFTIPQNLVSSQKTETVRIVSINAALDVLVRIAEKLPAEVDDFVTWLGQNTELNPLLNADLVNVGLCQSAGVNQSPMILPANMRYHCQELGLIPVAKYNSMTNNLGFLFNKAEMLAGLEQRGVKLENVEAFDGHVIPYAPDEVRRPLRNKRNRVRAPSTSVSTIPGVTTYMLLAESLGISYGAAQAMLKAHNIEAIGYYTPALHGNVFGTLVFPVLKVFSALKMGRDKLALSNIKVYDGKWTPGKPPQTGVVKKRDGTEPVEIRQTWKDPFGSNEGLTQYDQAAEDAARIAQELATLTSIANLTGTKLRSKEVSKKEMYETIGLGQSLTLAADPEDFPAARLVKELAAKRAKRIAEHERQLAAIEQQKAELQQSLARIDSDLLAETQTWIDSLK